MTDAAGGRPRVVLVTRPTDLESLLAIHGTREQARFFLAGRGQRLDEVEARHEEFDLAFRSARAEVPARWRFVRIDRGDLPSFVFEPEDLVLVVGQDGLVANAAKYLQGQLVVGVNPAPGRYPGVLVRHRAAAVGPILRAWRAERLDIERRTMVAAELDDGQRLLALNELFVGHRTHQSARYRLEYRGAAEEHSSSGLIVATGTGSTGWALSISRPLAARVALPSPMEARLVFFVREPWPSPVTGTAVAAGELGADDRLAIVSHMNEGGAIFGDGIESDRLEFGWGRRASLRIAETCLRLVVGF